MLIFLCENYKEGHTLDRQQIHVFVMKYLLCSGFSMTFVFFSRVALDFPDDAIRFRKGIKQHFIKLKVEPSCVVWMESEFSLYH